VITHKRFIRDPKANLSWLQKQSKEEILWRMFGYCLNQAECRRAQVLRYFGETFDPADCQESCDNCKLNSVSPYEMTDVTDRAIELYQLVSEIEQDKVTVAHVANVYYGSAAQKVRVSFKLF
jgi:bloom syndrome protein